MYCSRSKSNGVEELIRDHLADVGKLAGEFAAVWGGGAEAKAAGAMHDIGKYGDLFQRVLRGQASHVDHWTAGAYLAAKRYGKQGAAMALAIQGHHAGLQQGCLSLLNQSLLLAEIPQPGNNRQWAGNPINVLEQRWYADARPEPPESLSSPYTAHAAHAAAAMLDVRMLFSALVDADWLSAEAHMNRDERGPVYRPRGPALRASDDLAKLMAHVECLREQDKAAAPLRTIRDRLLRLCLEGGADSPGLYTLAAPTGAGKTFSTLAWALRQCETHDLRRIIVVLPYLSILDQTLSKFREVFLGREPGYIIEDDSLARDIDGDALSRLLSENWDAPVVVTTTVRFFESLFSDRPADCRKLHRIAGSVVLFDEAQTLPLPLAVPTLAAVASLVANYRCSALFSTATQPAFDSFSDEVNRLAGIGWNPKPLAPADAGLFDLPRRVRVEYEKQPAPLRRIAEQMSARKVALAIVNLKRHAKALYDELKKLGCQDALHLSTAMCPAHRRETLEEVGKRLKSGQACRLAATQCLEAGVDLSFPALWRALAPMDALCQAAGRCNREGRLSIGEMKIFIPEPDGKQAYPDDAYQNAAKLVYEIDDLNGFPDIFDPDVIRDYYKHLYARSRSMQDQNGKITAELETAIKRRDFPEVARLYRWIGKQGINILVPYRGRMELYEELAAQAKQGAVNAAWFRRAREITVGAFVGWDSPALGWLAQVKKKKEAVEGWYVLVNEDLYEEATGLSLEKAEDGGQFIADGR